MLGDLLRDFPDFLDGCFFGEGNFFLPLFGEEGDLLLPLFFFLFFEEDLYFSMVILPAESSADSFS